MHSLPQLGSVADSCDMENRKAEISLSFHQDLSSLFFSHEAGWDPRQRLKQVLYFATCLEGELRPVKKSKVKEAGNV